MDYFNFISEKAKLNPNADDPDKLGAGLYSRNLEKDQVTFIPKSRKQSAIYSKSPISLYHIVLLEEGGKSCRLE